MTLEINLRNGSLVTPVKIEGEYLANLTKDQLWAIFEKMKQSSEKAKP